MNIKRVSFAVIAGLSLALASPLFADGHAKSQKMEVRTENVLDKVQLSDDQKLGVQAIKERYQPQLDSLHASKLALKEQHAALDKTSPDYAEQAQLLETQIAEIKLDKANTKKQMQAEIMQLLTPEQRSSIENSPSSVE